MYFSAGLCIILKIEKIRIVCLYLPKILRRETPIFVLILVVGPLKKKGGGVEPRKPLGKTLFSIE